MIVNYGLDGDPRKTDKMCGTHATQTEREFPGTMVKAIDEPG